MLTPLEQMTVEAFRKSQRPPTPDEENEAWTLFGLTVALESGKMLRAAALKTITGAVETKSDGSPVTSIERKVETMVYHVMEVFGLQAATVGEEWGGELPDSGLAVAVDPVDGTWAFLSDTGTSATTVAVFRDGDPFLGVVASHVTAEIGYALKGQAARVVRLGCYGEPDSATSLPFGNRDHSRVLVNVHPSRESGDLMETLYSAWVDGTIRMVRSPGGSPAWALLEAAKGRFMYVNRWSDKPSAPWDLAAGVLLVRSAGGDVVSLNGTPVDAVRHAGAFVAGIDSDARALVTSLAG